MPSQASQLPQLTEFGFAVAVAVAVAECWGEDFLVAFV